MPSRNQVFPFKSLANLFTPQRENNYRPQLLHPDSFLVLGFIAVGFFALIQTVRFFPSLHNSVLGFQSSITIEEVVAQTNHKRQEQGLSPLTVNPQLSAAALAKAQDMLDDQYWAHTSPSGKKPWDFIKSANYHYKVAGENLARDFGRTNDMMRAWMESPTHRANILNDRYEQIGVALVYGQLEGFDTALVVQMFGSPSGGVAQVGDGSVSGESDQSAPAHNPILAIDPGAGTEPKALPPGDRQTTGEKVSLTNSSQESTEEPIRIYSDDVAVTRSSQPIQASALTPLALTKIVFLAVVMMIILTLIYDSFVIGNKKNMRLVGENFGHIILFVCVAFLLIIFKGGVIR